MAHVSGEPPLTWASTRRSCNRSLGRRHLSQEAGCLGLWHSLKSAWLLFNSLPRAKFEM